MTPMESNANDFILFLFTVLIVTAIIQGIIDYFKDGTFKKNRESVKASIIKHEKGIFGAIMFVIILPAVILFFAFLEHVVFTIPTIGLIVTFIVGISILIKVILKFTNRSRVSRPPEPSNGAFDKKKNTGGVPCEYPKPYCWIDAKKQTIKNNSSPKIKYDTSIFTFGILTPAALIFFLWWFLK